MYKPQITVLDGGNKAETANLPPEVPAFEDLRLDEREELGLGQTRRDPVGENGMRADDVPERFTYRAELCDPESPDRMEIFTADSDENAIKQALEYCAGEVVLLELHQLTDDYEFVRAVDISQPRTIAIELPATNVKPEILTALLNSKASLIETALGEDCAWQKEYGTDGLPLCDLPIEFDNGAGKVRFEWLKYGADSEAVKAWSEFLAAAVKFCKTANRITAKDAPVENQKFAFRTFLVKIGLNDTEHKQTRKYLLRNLAGDSAFATPESKQKWLEKHGAKKEQ
jgi:hypothetical protein